MDAATVRSRLENDEPVTVIDVRTPAEFETAHICGSHNVPLPLLNEHAEETTRRPAATWSTADSAPKAPVVTAAVGAGLTIAALTDTCAMSRLLCRLPHNHGTDEPTRESVLTQLLERQAA